MVTTPNFILFYFIDFIYLLPLILNGIFLVITYRTEQFIQKHSTYCLLARDQLNTSTHVENQLHMS
jgi:hypothetical protein